MINFEKELNPAQLEAVHHLSGPALVIAGAGSGKTRVIEYRVLYLVQNHISPSSILLLTFTRKAAHEMLSRAEKHNSNCKKVEGGTFHSFAWKTLKNYGKIIDLSSSFSILDEDDSQQAIKRCMQSFSLDKRNVFPKKETIKSIISVSTNKEMSISEILDREYPHFLEYLPQIEDLKESYAKYKREKNYLDYDDLLVHLRTLLKDKTVRESLSRRYQYIMVDEYQDTNILQGDITYYLAEKHQNVMVVGDDAQSIYGFRGASHRNIMEFPKRFPRCKIIKLQDNYRSTQSILNVGNCILENMKNKYSKCLVSVKGKGGEVPKVLPFKDAYEEAKWIVDKIVECHLKEKIPLFSQCVLFRSAYVSFPLQAELTKRNIPYRVFGGMRFQEMAHIKDIISYFRVVNNIRDEIAWRRLLLLMEGIGEKTATNIIEDIISDGALYLGKENWIEKNHKYPEELKKLHCMLKNISSQEISPEEKFAVALSFYLPIFKEKFDDWNTRINDLFSLKQISSHYSSVEQFLVDLAVESPDKGVRDTEMNIEQKERPLTLSTIHSAKGLEWECVFFLGLVDGVLPSYFALKNEDDLEEERRLFYVGVTRAKKYLFLSEGLLSI